MDWRSAACAGVSVVGTPSENRRTVNGSRRPLSLVELPTMSLVNMPSMSMPDALA